MTSEADSNHLKVAHRHLERVQAAWDDATDWDDLSLYGFYCLEAAVMAASDLLGWTTKAQHTDKARAARRLHDERGLPDVEDLLGELNQARKASAYGNIESPELDAEDVAFGYRSLRRCSHSTHRGRGMTRRGGPSVTAANRRAALRWQTVEAQSWFAEHLRRWSADPHVLAVIAVGSTVRPTAEPSDADFVIIWEGQRPDVARAPIELDLRLYERSRAEALIAQGHDYLTWAVRLGQLVHEKADFWTHFREQWFEAAPWPSADEAEQRAQRAGRYKQDLAAAGDMAAAHEQSVSELTHRARAALLRAGVFPQSRPELPAQLREIHENELADELERALATRSG